MVVEWATGVQGPVEHFRESAFQLPNVFNVLQKLTAFPKQPRHWKSSLRHLPSSVFRNFQKLNELSSGAAICERRILTPSPSLFWPRRSVRLGASSQSHSPSILRSRERENALMTGHRKQQVLPNHANGSRARSNVGSSSITRLLPMEGVADGKIIHQRAHCSRP